MIDSFYRSMQPPKRWRWTLHRLVVTAHSCIEYINALPGCHLSRFPRIIGKFKDVQCRHEAPLIDYHCFDRKFVLCEQSIDAFEASVNSKLSIKFRKNLTLTKSARGKPPRKQRASYLFMFRWAGTIELAPDRPGSEGVNIICNLRCGSTKTK